MLQVSLSACMNKSHLSESVFQLQVPVNIHILTNNKIRTCSTQNVLSPLKDYLSIRLHWIAGVCFLFDSCDSSQAAAALCCQLSASVVSCWCLITHWRPKKGVRMITSWDCWCWFMDLWEKGGFSSRCAFWFSGFQQALTVKDFIPKIMAEESY